MAKKFEEFPKDMARRGKEVDNYIANIAPRIVGTESVNHFKESFFKGGFTDATLVPWKPAKRTNPSSVWYGFEYGAKTPTPNNHPKRHGTKRKYMARKSNSITNFSPAATKRRTLTGSSGDLKNSIKYTTSPRQTQINSNLPYAKVQNEGGFIKVFGGKSAQIPARKFMGESIKLQARIKQQFNKDLNNILKK